MNNEWLDDLQEGASLFGITLTPAVEKQYAQFMELFLARNRVMNLTAITEPHEVAIKHFLDSLSVECVWQPQRGERVIDIGTGGGFPGMPLAIRHPSTEFLLNDSMRKKVDFLRETIMTMGLTNAVPCWGRAETLGRDARYRAKFSVALVRAVAHLGMLIEYSLPLLQSGGRLIAMKGPSGEEEIGESTRALQQLGGVIQQVHHLTLPGAGERLLIVIEKVRSTPTEFPRDGGAMKKKPLFLDSRRLTP